MFLKSGGGEKMSELITWLGIVPTPGYEFVYDVIIGCLAVIVIDELFGWFSVVCRALLLSTRRF